MAIPGHGGNRRERGRGWGHGQERGQGRGRGGGHHLGRRGHGTVGYEKLYSPNCRYEKGFLTAGVRSIINYANTIIIHKYYNNYCQAFSSFLSIHLNRFHHFFHLLLL